MFHPLSPNLELSVVLVSVFSLFQTTPLVPLKLFLCVRGVTPLVVLLNGAKHTNTLTSPWGCVCVCVGGDSRLVYIADPLCASVLDSIPNPCTWRTSYFTWQTLPLCGKQKRFSCCLFFLLMSHWVSRVQLWNMCSAKFNSWFVFEVMPNDVQPDGVCAIDADNCEHANIMMDTKK